MSSNLKRAKTSFLMIAFLSFIIILISYNWNVSENVYGLVKDISKTRFDYFRVTDSKITHNVKDDKQLNDNVAVTPEQNNKPTRTEKTEDKEKRQTKESAATEGLDLVFAITTENNEVSKGVQTVNDKTTEASKRTDTKGVKPSLINESAKPSLINEGVKPSLINESVKPGFDKKTVSNNLREDDKIKVIATENKDKQTAQDLAGNSTSGNNFEIQTLKSRKKERQKILDKIHKLRDELLRDHQTTTELTALHRSSKSKIRPIDINDGDDADRFHKADQNEAHETTKHRFRNIGLGGNLINPVLWMHRNNAGASNFINNVEPGVTSRPDVCADCFETSFRYILNEPGLCMGDIDLIILITSIVSRRESRDAIRNTWCAESNKPSSKMKHVFVFGNTNDSIANAELVKESQQFHDIIQMDFYDTYANLTYKTISSFQWSRKFCQNARYVMKTDDDMYVNTELLPLLLKKTPDSNFIGGMCWGPSSPHRDLNSKWYVSFVQYRHSLFPSMCSGTGYIMSRDTVTGILRQSPSVPFFHLEDVYVAICVKRLGIHPYMVEGFKNTLADFEPCAYRNQIITSHELSSQFLQYVWKQSRTCPKEDLKPEMLYRAYLV